jgi:N-acetylglucosaminyldiphosphoundecaprenol N-acetyl-beta-D-mannosaminyltransferase
MRKTVAILGIPIDDLNTAEAIERLDQFVQSGRFHQVATANTDFLIKAHEDPELRAILRNADLVVPDGMPVVLASRWLRSGLRERVTGADLVPKLATLCAEKGYRVFMLGARKEVACRAKERLEEDNPGIQIVGCESPPVGHIVTMDNESILADIEAAKPHILLVAFGNPKQEKWIYMHRHRLNVPVCIGVGGTFDFIAGTVTRAPEWMQKSGMEWLYRLAQEPKRLWKRYFNDVVHFVRFIVLQLWVMRTRDNGGVPRITDIAFGDCTVLSVEGTLGTDRLVEFQRAANRALDAKRHLVLDLQATTHIDSAVLGTLLNLPKRAAHHDREVRLVGLNKQVLRMLRVAEADNMFHSFPTMADALRGDALDPLDVRVSTGGAQAFVVLRGRASAEHLGAVEAALADLPAANQEIIVDLRHVSYIDSAILATLRAFADKMNGGGVRVCLATGESVSRILTREKLQDLFPVTDVPVTAQPIAAEV